VLVFVCEFGRLPNPVCRMLLLGVLVRIRVDRTIVTTTFVLVPDMLVG